MSTPAYRAALAVQQAAGDKLTKAERALRAAEWEEQRAGYAWMNARAHDRAAARLAFDAAIAKAEQLRAEIPPLREAYLARQAESAAAYEFTIRSEPLYEPRRSRTRGLL